MNEFDRDLEIAQHRWMTGDTAGAIDALRMVLSQAPEHAYAHALLAGCLLDSRRIHAALHEVELALGLEPDLFMARYLYAQVLVAHRRFAEATEALGQLIAEHPTAPELYRAMSDLVTARGEGGSEECRVLLKKALELEPDSPATLADCAQFHLHRGELDDARLMAGRALEASPEHLRALWIMGEVLLLQGQVDEAREHAAWVLSKNAEHRGALFLLAKLKARRSPLMGPWWRFISWVGLGGEARGIIILLGMYVVFRVSSLTLEIEGYDAAFTALNFAWLGFVVYCLVAPVMFRKALQSELEQVTLKRDF